MVKFKAFFQEYQGESNEISQISLDSSAHVFMVLYFFFSSSSHVGSTNVLLELLYCKESTRFYEEYQLKGKEIKKFVVSLIVSKSPI